MEKTAASVSTKQKNTIRVIVFAVILTALVIIPFGVMHGGLGQGWMLVANVVYCLGLAVIGIGAVAWIVMRVRKSRAI